jgi:hypothetical protein
MRAAAATLSAMYAMPEEPAVRDRSTAVTVIASVVAVLAAVGIYLHPDRVRTCLVSGAETCDPNTPVLLGLLIAVAVAATAVALVATVCGLVGDWRTYRRTH